MLETIQERIARLPPNKLALLAAELYQRSRVDGGAAEPIAITAMACRMPGADTPEAFWRFLERGGDAIERIPAERLAMAGITAAAVDGRGAGWGSFLDEVDGFDPAVFGIPAKEAESMDPQQRILLELCWEALENAGTPIDAVDSGTGVFMGVSGVDYALLGRACGRQQDGYAVTGHANAIIAGRISYVFGLTGPSAVVDTACSASAAAIHLACQSLRAHECEQALAGGINLVLMPQITQTVAGLNVLAADGRCKAFAADADGFVRGEGAGVIVLRRLADAVARQDPILGVVRGSAWNQDGRSGGLTAPNGAAQERVIRAALASAGLTPDRISYVEAHGTGTALGDPIELAALGRIFACSARRDQKLLLGSVKTNIGHLEAAAGVAGVIKVLLALRHQTIPPHLHAATLTDRVDWASLPMAVPAARHAWPAGGQPRVAGVSSFGISGTNVHLVIGEPPAQLDPDPVSRRSPVLLTVSAKSEAALIALARRYAEALRGCPDVDIAAFAAAANLRRAHFPHRLALLAEAAEAGRALERVGAGEFGGPVQRGVVEHHRSPRIGLLLDDTVPDAALLAWLLAEPVFRAAYDGWLAAIGQAATGNRAAALAPTPAAIGCQFALAELWRSWGVRPTLVAGSGAGEIAAALVAGILCLEDAARLAVGATARSPAGAAAIPLVAGSLPDVVEAGQVPPAGFLASLGRASATAPPGGRATTLVDRLIALPGRDCHGVLGDLAALYIAGAAIDWPAFHRHDRPGTVPLPNYPFQRTRFWTPLPTRATLAPATPSPPDGEAGPLPAAATTSTDKDLLAAYTSRIAAATDVERRALVVDFIRRRAVELLNLPAASAIADDRPLLELGLDSLGGLELRNDLQTLLGARLPPTLFFDCPTIADLARFLNTTPARGEQPAPTTEREHVYI